MAAGEQRSKGAARLCRSWVSPEGLLSSSAKGALTNPYNQRPTWLQHAHTALDRAVWAAYGWDDPVPADVEEDTILARLQALNLERERHHRKAWVPLASEVGGVQAIWRAWLRPTRNLSVAALF